jgi:hypothetical protein
MVWGASHQRRAAGSLSPDEQQIASNAAWLSAVNRAIEGVMESN